jgi:nucleoside 2-deoxyribosyltransferase
MVMTAGTAGWAGLLEIALSLTLIGGSDRSMPTGNSTQQEKRMPESEEATSREKTNSEGPYIVYSAGGLFTQDELAANILLKEAVWKLSGGKFQLFLPQSRELQELDRPDVEAHIRNTDLLEIVKADMILARFDGPELDSGTVVEFVVAKCLGKPAVILRSDFRRVSFANICEPYNLMAKNWPRTVEVQFDSYEIWSDIFTNEYQRRSDSDSLQDLMKAELGTMQKSFDEVARRVIAGLEAVMEMKSPYPPEYQEVVYQAFRHSPGSGFGEIMTEGVLEGIFQRLRRNGTL